MRWVLVGFLLLFTWMMLFGWETATHTQRVGDAVFSAFMLVLALGVAAPTRFVWALRVTAAAVFVAYAIYFIAEVVRLLDGGHQRFALNTPSATTAGIGLLVYGIPALVFALGAERVGLARLFRTRSDVEPDDENVDHPSDHSSTDLP